jgi:hypothetical protein
MLLLEGRLLLLLVCCCVCVSVARDPRGLGLVSIDEVLVAAPNHDLHMTKSSHNQAASSK